MEDPSGALCSDLNQVIKKNRAGLGCGRKMKRFAVDHLKEELIEPCDLTQMPSTKQQEARVVINVHGYVSG